MGRVLLVELQDQGLGSCVLMARKGYVTELQIHYLPSELHPSIFTVSNNG